MPFSQREVEAIHEYDAKANDAAHYRNKVISGPEPVVRIAEVRQVAKVPEFRVPMVEVVKPESLAALARLYKRIA